jgi:hypothetical protein
VEKARAENEAKDTAEKNAIKEADAALAPDDCKRSTNKFLQSCIDAAVATAKAENDAQNVALEKAATKKAADVKAAAAKKVEAAKKLEAAKKAAAKKAAAKKAKSTPSPKPSATKK